MTNEFRAELTKSRDNSIVLTPEQEENLVDAWLEGHSLRSIAKGLGINIQGAYHNILSTRLCVLLRAKLLGNR